MVRGKKKKRMVRVMRKTMEEEEKTMGDEQISIKPESEEDGEVGKRAGSLSVSGK
jgi:hypothetical protein